MRQVPVNEIWYDSSGRTAPAYELRPSLLPSSPRRGRPIYLIQILLPLYDNAGAPLPRELYARVREELTGKYGGLTAFSRAPAEGLWQEGSETKRDDIVVLEVMADQLDRAWWQGYRRDLERAFRQEAIVVRAQELDLL
jgi:hypothetical protein